MTKSNYRSVNEIDSQKTITLPILSDKKCDLKDKSSLMSDLQVLLNECQPVKLIEQVLVKSFDPPMLELVNFEKTLKKTRKDLLNEETDENPFDKDCPYKKICHSSRINMIYMNKILGKDKMWVSHNLSFNYTTV